MSHWKKRRKGIEIYSIDCFQIFYYNLLFFLLMLRRDSYFLSCTTYLTYESCTLTS